MSPDALLASMSSSTRANARGPRQTLRRGPIVRSLVPLMAHLITLVAAFVVIAALYDAFYLPGTLGIATRSSHGGAHIVSWVEPGGSAWAAGIRPGDAVWPAPHHRRDAVVARIGQRRIVVSPDVTMPSQVELLDAGLGLLLLGLGAFVLRRGSNRAISVVFWLVCLLAGVAIALNPSASHGAPWALVAQAVAVRLFGPALLTTAQSFAARRASRKWRGYLLWGPALTLIPLYAAYWVSPSFPRVVAYVDWLALGAYIVMACAVLATSLRHAQTAQERAQGRWLALGLVGGLAPFILLTLLPHILAGRELAPVELSILAFVLLPIAMTLAIAHTEMFGIAGLLRRAYVRALVYASVLIASAASAGWIATEGPRQWGWPAAAIAASAIIVAAPCAAAATPLLRRLERLALPDAYDLPATIQSLNRELDAATVAAHDRDQPSLEPFVMRLGTVLNAANAALLTPHDRWVYIHPRSMDAPSHLEAMIQRAEALFELPATIAVPTERVGGSPMLFVPIRAVGEDRRLLAVLGLGPKRNGDRYTAQDRLLLDMLAHSIAVVLGIARTRQTEDLGQAMGQGEQSSSTQAPGPADDAGVSPLLSLRQVQVLHLLADGLTYKELAQRMELSGKTIETHVECLYRKLGVRNRAQAIRQGQRLGILPGQQAPVTNQTEDGARFKERNTTV